MYSELASSALLERQDDRSTPSHRADRRPERTASALGQTEFVPAGSTIFHQDDPAQHLYYVIHGSVTTSLVTEDGNRQITGFLSQGAYFGSVFCERYKASAEAVTACTLIRYCRRNWSGESPRALYKQIILDALQSELKTAEDSVQLLGRRTACAKVAAFLLYLSERAVDRGEAGNPISVPMTRYDIADYFGLTSESVSRCFTKLKRAGLISMTTPDSVTLIDRRALADGSSQI